MRKSAEAGFSWPNRRQVAWLFYDWANSAFALTVMAVLFPIGLRQFWMSGADVNPTLVLGLANAAASLVMAVMGPVLGAWADSRGGRLGWLVRFAALGAAATAAISLAAQGQWWLAASAFVLATIGFAGANVFYDALLVVVAEPDERPRLSAYGFALGYIGSSLLFIVHLMMLKTPESFGLDSADQALRVAIGSVAIWWGVFSIPIIRALRDGARTGEASPAIGAWQRLRGLWPHLRADPKLGWFLAAYWFYIDGVHTIIRMAVDYGQAIGLESSNLATAILITNLVGFPATVLYGLLAHRFGTFPALVTGVLAYLGITVLAVSATELADFYLLAVAVGLVQGGVQAMSRAMFANLVPPDDAAAWFGVYNIVGKFAAVLGPALVGIVSAVTNQPRLSIGSVAILLLVGLALLWQVRRTLSAGETALVK